MAPTVEMVLIIVSFMFYFGYVTASSNVIQESNNHQPLELKIFTSSLLELDLDFSFEISEQCRHDFNLYKVAILKPHVRNNETNQTFIDNLWAYKSRFVNIISNFIQSLKGKIHYSLI